MMKFSIETKEFIGLVKRVSVAIGKKRVMPILDHVLIGVFEGRLSASATDTSMYCVGFAPCEQFENGSSAVSCQKLLGVLQAMRGDFATVSLSGGLLQVKCGRSSVKLSTLPAEDFPQPPKQYGDGVKIDGIDAWVRQMLPKIATFSAVNDVRPYLNAVLLSANGKSALLAASDGYKAGVSIREGEFSDVECIIPSHGVAALSAMFNSISGEDIDFSVYRNGVHAVSPNMSLWITSVDTKYPDIHRIIGDMDFDDWATILSADGIAAARQVNFTSGEYCRATIRAVPGEMELSASSKGESSSCVIKMDGGAQFELGINAEYVAKMLAVTGEYTKIRVGDGRLFFKGDGMHGVIMGMR